jgi:hypothetical protein
VRIESPQQSSWALEAAVAAYAALLRSDAAARSCSECGLLEAVHLRALDAVEGRLRSLQPVRWALRIAGGIAASDAGPLLLARCPSTRSLLAVVVQGTVGGDVASEAVAVVAMCARFHTSATALSHDDALLRALARALREQNTAGALRDALDALRAPASALRGAIARIIRKECT